MQISYPQGGVDGVVVYFIEDLYLSLAIVYSVGGYKNLWSVVTYPGRLCAKGWMYLFQLLVFKNVAGKDVNDKRLLCGLKYDGLMSTSAQAILKIDINNEHPPSKLGGI